MALYQSGTGLSAMIGIGTTNPTSNLNVVGNVYATNNIITSSSFYGVLAGSNTISCTSISSGGTIKTSYAQGTNLPDTGQAYFYNPTNSAGQCASVAVRLAGSTSANAYYSYDVSGVAGFSHGITGASQNLVFKATWNFASATLFTMATTGTFTASGSIAANSDRRIKTDLQVIPNALEKVKKISGYTFKRTDADLPRQAGVIAQELLEVLPEVVHKNDEGIYSVSYGNIVALLIEALKEESAKREELEKKLHYSSIVVNCGESVIHI